MMGLTDAVKAFLTLQPTLIEAKARMGSRCTSTPRSAATAPRKCSTISNGQENRVAPNPFLKKK